MSVLTDWPLFVFPLFVIIFILLGRNLVSDITYAAVAGIFFDPFSGYNLGLFMIAILVVSFGTQALKRRINIDRSSFFLVFIFSAIFITLFLIVISSGRAMNSVLKIAPELLVQIVFMNIIMLILNQRLIYGSR